MEKEGVRVLFCGSDGGYADAIIRALGQGFEMRRSEKFTWGKNPELERWCDVVLLDLHAAEIDAGTDAGIRFLEEISGVEMPPPLIVILPAEKRSHAFKLMEKGAYDALASPPNIAELRLILQRAHKFYQAKKEAQQLRSQKVLSGPMYELIMASQLMAQVFSLAQKIAPCDVTVLITGETGTGKELLARAIHRMSSRASQPFVVFSCVNVPETLIEEELLGHEKGAFTGALMSRRGRLEAADRGTLFLDEVGDLGLGLQPKLLRVLQERTFERLGSNAPVAVNIRLVCATNQDLADMVQRGKFREDLYYRLNVVQLHLPPLRDRRDDIPLLAQHFLNRFAHQFGKKSKRYSRPVLQALEEYNWPGNVRELENIVQRAVVLAESSVIEMWHLPEMFRKGSPSEPLGHSYQGEVREFKRRLILRTLRQCGWRKTETARTLGMARNYLHRLINQLQIRADADNNAADPMKQPSPVDRIM